MTIKSSKKSIERTVEIMANDLTYLPSPTERKVKTAFWVRFAENPICDPRDITLAVVQRLSPDSRLDKWWSVPGFKEWFRNQEEFRERAEYLTNLAMDALEGILISDDPKTSSARVNAAKLLFEIARKMPSRQVEKYADERISTMDRKQLEEFISKRLHLVGTVEAPPSKKEEEEVTP